MESVRTEHVPVVPGFIEIEYRVLEDGLSTPQVWGPVLRRVVWAGSIRDVGRVGDSGWLWGEPGAAIVTTTEGLLRTMEPYESFMARLAGVSAVSRVPDPLFPSPSGSPVS